MKKRNYEKNTIIILACITIFLLEIIFIVILKENKLYNYVKISGIYIDENSIVTFLNKSERNTLYKNNYVYINNKKIRYEIQKDKGITLYDNNKKYYEIYLKIKIDKKNKLNDNITITIKNKKICLLEIFKLVWEGDVDS